MPQDKVGLFFFVFFSFLGGLLYMIQNSQNVFSDVRIPGGMSAPYFLIVLGASIFTFRRNGLMGLGMLLANAVTIGVVLDSLQRVRD